ncbi:hypothetical protein CJO90_14235 [Ralstonia solanacearum]|nr:hypothetical protein CJO83_14235 [Ralstonia solanacearum]AXW44071.1 hypothetical protein CJO90_14235 [Ralstonia solanacearum]AXW67411.1 hypothetical protein CJO95_14230 [Ralstonia solanacearum]
MRFGEDVDFNPISAGPCFPVSVFYAEQKQEKNKMAKNLIKTSHYMTPASRDEIQRLAQQHARSAGWVVRKCVEFGLAHAGQIDFHAPEEAQQIDPEFRKALDDFFGEQRP